MTPSSTIWSTEYLIDPKQGGRGWFTVALGENGHIQDVHESGTTASPDYCLVPAGIDIHSHIVSEGVHAARVLSGHPTVPAIAQLPALYHRIGYTTVVDAAVTPKEADLVRQWITQMPGLDVGFLVVAGEYPSVAEQVRQGSVAGVREALRELLESTGAWGVKVVNPSGSGRTPLAGLHEPGPLGVSPAEHIRILAEAIAQLGIPHPMHIHGLDLGVPGNIQTTLDMLTAIEGLPVHLAHAQFHAYRRGDQGGIESGADLLARWLNDHPEVTLDLGQIIFGPTVTVSADLFLQSRLKASHGGRWAAWRDRQGGMAAVSYQYRPTNGTNAVQWAVGLELALLINNPWQVYISVDHPNGGSFHAYPEIIRWLTSRDARGQILEQLPKEVQKRVRLSAIDREYTDEEIVISTSAGPAQSLGLKTKGHLGRGAVADLVAYGMRQGRLDWSRPLWMTRHGQRITPEKEAGMI